MLAVLAESAGHLGEGDAFTRTSADDDESSVVISVGSESASCLNARHLHKRSAGDELAGELRLHDLARNIFVTLLLDGRALRGSLSEFITVVESVEVAESNCCCHSCKCF